MDPAQDEMPTVEKPVILTRERTHGPARMISASEQHSLEIDLDLPRPQPSRSGLIALLLLQAITVAALVGSAYWVRRTYSQFRAQTLAMASMDSRLGSLNDQTESLKAEVVNLRTSLGSGATEDVLFLKEFILKPDINPDLARIIARNVYRYSALYGRDPNLVLAIIAVESNFDPRALSPVGAVGLMQVMPHWKKILGITGDLMDPETSIRYGLQVLGFYEEMYKDLEVVLTAYNRGPGPVDKALMKGVSPKNDYAPRVLQTYDRIRKLHVQSADR